MQQLKHTENTCCHYFLDLLFFSHLGESVYDPPLLKLTLVKLKYDASTLSYADSLPLIDSSNPS